MKIPRITCWIALAIVAVAIGWLAWQYLAAKAITEGHTWAENLGGSWQLEYHDTIMNHSGPSSRLFRLVGGRRVLVDELASNAIYLGDDCVVYASLRSTAGPEYLAKCGEMPEVLLVGPTYEEWRLTNSGLVRYAALGDDRIMEKLSIAEIKKRALSKPKG